MENITEKIAATFTPVKALVVYQCQSRDNETYVEAHDIDSNGCPINAHPLSVRETIALADCLNAARRNRTHYLDPTAFLPTNLLHINHREGYAVWHTPPQTKNLSFSDNLGIPCGCANIPSLLWKADSDTLMLYALKVKRNCQPIPDTVLYRAPFFNVYEDGKVCMGTVDTGFSQANGVEEFIHRWETAFFESYFTHLNSDNPPVKGNIALLWKSLVGSQVEFPETSLLPANQTIKGLL